GLGEVGVFVFFGLVATLGTTYTQADGLTWPSWLGAVGVGLLACALLMVNNLRDIPTDAVSGKRTLAVRLGDHRARRAYALLVMLPVLLGAGCAFASGWALMVLALFPAAVALAVTVLVGARGRALVPVLAGTGLLQLGYGMLLGLALALWALLGPARRSPSAGRSSASSSGAVRGAAASPAASPTTASPITA
ncbi:MAG: 1,4-dihydroxy-2-naphthoate octaprenyltransferase, partial [Cellulomonas sp.]|nr:1,4-dihydroxy-2-naphthoate octaprenyltransferase [Cellulomonas sp.]